MSDELTSSFSHLKRHIGRLGHHIHHLVATDTNGDRACYFVFVPPAQEKAFIHHLRNPGDEPINLEEWGKILGSCYGETPDKALQAKLLMEYGLDIS